MTLADLHPGDIFAFPGEHGRFKVIEHRDGSQQRRPWVDCSELEAGRHRSWRCFRPDRKVRLVKKAAT